ncbi:LOW QUALITY PROTEIN: serine/arginine-rich splicing factor SR45a [Raphanus sativus]|uniref:LOW QUALITY PROTEIN: serine/arginine-rich splicing factor SR45a n=1 Tax=Raphanus sativus TaxID=3726 RepID=A0A9W3D914_RAPSA|nr:LOW QUALITY PROTEIN: serine/arginine-rich splicing factor SR45a [Raphanus sativus]
MATESPLKERDSRSPSPRKQRSLSRSRSRSMPRSRSRSRSLPRARSRSKSRSLPRARSRSRSRSLPRHISPSRTRGRSEVENPGTTLYVTGLSTRVTDKDLESHFSKEGKVSSCFLVIEPRTRESRGFAFVTMDTLKDADRCIKYLNQSVLEGRYITVERQNKTKKRYCVKLVLTTTIRDDDTSSLPNIIKSTHSLIIPNVHIQLINYIASTLSTNQRTLSSINNYCFMYFVLSSVSKKASQNSHPRPLSWLEKLQRQW